MEACFMDESGMKTSFYLMALVGGLLPDALRLLAWARTDVRDRGPIPLKDPGVWIGSFIQAGLGMLAVFALEATTVLQALAMGYAAPEFLTRAFAAVLKERDQSHLSEAAPPTLRLLQVWWGS